MGSIFPSMAATLSYLCCLPPELLHGILQYLPKDALRAARLACRTTCASASGILFSTVTIAKRWRSLRNAAMLMEHDVLRRFIHTLIFDTSSYTAVADRESFANLLGVADYMEWNETRDDRMFREEAYQLHGAAVTMEAWLKEEGILEEVLGNALRLPRMKHIVLADYRCVGSTDEDELSVCERLFRSSPPPRYNSEPTCHADNELSELLKIAKKCPFRLDTFQCGLNPYALPGSPGISGGFDDPCGMPMSALRSISGSPVIQNLTRLHLVLYTWHAPATYADTQALRKVLRKSRECLRDLTVHLMYPDLHMGTDGPDHDTCFPPGLVRGHCFLHFFNLIFHTVVFPKLEILDLGGLPFYQRHLGDFLLRHSPTLDHLRLLFCFYDEGIGPRMCHGYVGEQSSNKLSNLVAQSCRLTSLEFQSV